MTTTLILTIAFFLTVILMLVSLLLFVKAKLSPEGKLKITINGEQTLEVDGGSTLLTTLGNNGVFLPSACGGGGTCVQCKCQVNTGGGSILPTETPHFSRKEIADNWRLGCQVKVKEDMEIQVPEEVFGIKKWECEVVSNYNVASFHQGVRGALAGRRDPRLRGRWLHPSGRPDDDRGVQGHRHHRPPGAPQGPQHLPERVGQVWVVGPQDGQRRAHRPRLLHGQPPGRGQHRDAQHPDCDATMGPRTQRWMQVNPGICSSFVFAQKPGDKVTISGPYGEFFIKETEAEMVYIGGGAGMAPMRSHLFHLFHTLKTGRKVTFFYGGRSKRELFYVDDFRAIEKEFPNFKFHLVLSEPAEGDNWNEKKDIHDEGDGFLGFVHNAVIDHHLKDHEAPEDIEFYFCGPPMMNQAVLKMCDDWGVPPENVAFDDFGG